MIDLVVFDFLKARFGDVGSLATAAWLLYSTISWSALTAPRSFVALARIIDPASSTTGIKKS